MKLKEVEGVFKNEAGTKYLIKGTIENVALINQEPEYMDLHTMGQRITTKVMAHGGIGCVIDFTSAPVFDVIQTESCDLCLQINDDEWLAPLGHFICYNNVDYTKICFTDYTVCVYPTELCFIDYTVCVHPTKEHALAYIMEQKLKEVG